MPDGFEVEQPMIGVTVSEIRAKEDAQRVSHGEPTQTEMTLGLSYMRAVERAGGLPVALPPLRDENVEPLLDQLSGLLLTGGPDIDPACYGAEPHPELGPIDHDVDVFEIELCRHADRRGMPILGICRGSQVLNVARGGHPDPAPARHRRRTDRAPPDRAGRSHDPRGAGRARQRPGADDRRRPGAGQLVPPPGDRPAGRRPAPGRVGRRTAWSRRSRTGRADGQLVLGVQWHAETLTEEAEQLALFERLVEAAGARARERAALEQRTGRGGLRCPCGLRRSTPRARSAPAEAGRAPSSRPNGSSPERARRPSPAETRHGAWSDWAPAGVTPWTVGVEEEVMLLDPSDWSLASRGGRGDETADRASCWRTRAPRRTGRRWSCGPIPHEHVGEGLSQLERLRGELAAELATLDMKAAVAGIHPFTQWQSTKISEGDRYRFLYGSMRELARREPTFALHVHVAVPDAESAMLAANRLRSHLPLLLALSANSPFWQGRETGLASARTPLFQAFPRVGIPRAFADYEDYVLDDRSAAALRGVPRADVPVVGRAPAAALRDDRGADHGRADAPSPTRPR